MYSLFCEAKFWTLSNEIHIRDTDFGAFSYHDKKEIIDCPYQEGKRTYCEKRGSSLILSNKRPLKLKDALKDLEQYLSNNKIVFHCWKDESILQLILNIGVIVNVGVNIHNGDVGKITFDKFLVGKLLSENITDVVSTKMHLIISYNENQLTLVSYNKLSTRNMPEKLARLEPKIQQVDLSGPSGRRLERKLSANVSGDMILTWWHSSRNEVYPWSPLVKDKDRANVHVYSLSGNKLELLCFYRTEFDQICVSFSKLRNNCIWLVEQKVSKKGDVTVEYSSHEVVNGFLKKISITSIPLQTQVCSHSLSPDEEKLILGCIDGSLILFDEGRGITKVVKTAFIPNLVSWHSDGSLIMVANERSQFQCFDIALSCVRAQLLSEDLTPSNLIDLASYFKTQPTLIFMDWKKKPVAPYYSGKYVPNDNFLLLIFEGGPLGVLNLIGGGGLSGDNQRKGLTSDVIIRQYLLWNQVDKAINLLLSLNWNTNGATCLAGLYHIANFVFRYPLTVEKVFQMETALGSFHVPLRPLTRSTEIEFADQVHDLTRRFFHQLLRYQLYEKAYRLAIDLNDSDLFVDFYHCARSMNDGEMAAAARAKFDEIVFRSDNSSNCSNSSCSCSVSSEISSSEPETAVSKLPPLPQVSVKKQKNSKIPPLPDLNRHVKSRESAFFNRNSIYLHNDTINTIPEERPSELSNSLESVTVSTSFNDLSPPQNVKPQDFRLSITPEQSQSYETSTSFCDRLISKKCKIHGEDLVSSPSTLSVIEKLYDLPAEPKNGESFRKTLYNRSISSENLENRNIRSNQSVYEPLKSARFQVEDIHFSRALARPGSLDNLRKILENRSAPGGRSILMKPTMIEPKNFPKPTVHLLPTNKYNNMGQFKPLSNLSYCPTPFSKHCLKTTANHPPTKQKVKFSDTVTQIMVPDISNMSIDDDCSLPDTKARSESVRMTDQDKALNEDLRSELGSEMYHKNFGKSQDRRQVSDGNNGTIKLEQDAYIMDRITLLTRSRQSDRPSSKRDTFGEDPAGIS